MAGIDVEITSNKDEILEAFGEQIGQALIAIGLAGESNAKNEITKAVYDQPESKSGYARTGRLRNGISHGVDTTEQAVYIGTNVEYGPYVELGTSKMKARPFLKPAVENYSEEYKELTEQALS